MFVQVSASACSLMRRIQDRFCSQCLAVETWKRTVPDRKCSSCRLRIYYCTAIHLPVAHIKHVIYPPAGHAWPQREGSGREKNG